MVKKILLVLIVALLTGCKSQYVTKLQACGVNLEYALTLEKCLLEGKQSLP